MSSELQAGAADRELLAHLQLKLRDAAATHAYLTHELRRARATIEELQGLIEHAADRADGLIARNTALVEENERLRQAMEKLVWAVARARAAEDNWYRSGQDEASAMDRESAEVTLITRENEARAALALR